MEETRLDLISVKWSPDSIIRLKAVNSCFCFSRSDMGFVTSLSLTAFKTFFFPLVPIMIFEEAIGGRREVWGGGTIIGALETNVGIGASPTTDSSLLSAP
jgi:hypothetical protein